MATTNNRQTHILAAAPTTTRATPVRLSVDVKSARIAYAANKSVFLRSLENPDECVQYTGHTHQVTVAKFSTSGHYVASGDITGSVKIWGCTGEEQIEKNEVKVLNGRITDIAWDADSQRIIAVGDGKERWGHCFTMDSGNSVGEVSGHSAVPNAVAIRMQRPYRAATASDDGSVVFYHGPPYKFNKLIKKHSKFVYDVQFSPNGEFLVSVGADAKIFLYDGKTGDDIAEIADSNGHSGSIFAVSWDPSSTYILTSSADHTTKVWDIRNRKLVQSWSFIEADAVAGQQVGNIWINKFIISLSFSGTLSYLSLESDEPVRQVFGHQKAITTMALTLDGNSIITGSYDTVTLKWDVASRNATRVGGKGHTNQIVQSVAATDGVVSVALDDTLRLLDADNCTYTENKQLTEGQPKGVAIGPSNTRIVITSCSINLYTKDRLISSIATDYSSSACAASPSNPILVIGAEDAVVRLYTLNNQSDSITLMHSFVNNRARITALAISPDSSKLAVGDSSGKIILYDLHTKAMITSRWAFHVGWIASLAFSETGSKVVSAGYDTHVYIWSVANPGKYLALKNAHQGGAVGAVWIGENEIMTAGNDACLKRWHDLAL